MLFFIPGANGSGKTTVIPELRRLLPDMQIYDFDRYPDRKTGRQIATPEERQDIAEEWLQVALANAPQHTIVSGLGIMGEVFACPSAPQLDHIAFCLLDCADIVRLDRLKARGTPEHASMEMLCWAAWLRVHHIDPGFRQDVINNGNNPRMIWERWTAWERGNPHWRAHYIDTTPLSVDATVTQIVQWIQAEQTLYNDGYRLQFTHP